MKKPNVFILGAPKCGTTSLASWLSEHPEVFMCPVKEPHYFNFDFATRGYTTLRSYERLFRKASSEHNAVAEASVRYLYSRAALMGIKKYAEDPRLIVMMRDPVSMVQSLHQQTLYNGWETVRDFESAWSLQARRAYGLSIPERCPDSQLLQYGELCKIGKQIRGIFEQGLGSQTFFIDLDMMRAQPCEVYRSVLKFLSLKDDRRADFPVINAAKTKKFEALHRLLEQTNHGLRRVGISGIRTGLTSLVKQHAHRAAERPQISTSMKLMLATYFEKDIQLVERLLGRNFTHWRQSDVFYGKSYEKQ